MLMSILATSSAVAGRPSFGGAISAAMAAPAAKHSAVPNIAILDIDVAHLAVSCDRPALNGAEMEVLPRRILRGPIGVCLLHNALLVGGAAHQCCGLAVPHPGQAEARQRLGQHRACEGRLRPALAAIGR